MAAFDKIAKFAGKFGKKAAEEEFGKDAVKSATQNIKRRAEQRAKKSSKSEKDSNVTVTPTRIIAVRPKAEQKVDKEVQRKKIEEASEGVEVTKIPEGEKGASKSKRRMSPKRAREAVGQQTGEPRFEFNARIEREARQTGVKPGEGPAGPPEDIGYTPDQITDAMRGRTDLDAEPDLTEIVRGLMNKKRGGKVSYKKSGGKVSPRGCGKALRGYGKAMKGYK